MVVLVVFAVVAGAGTALSPCVLPVLPALLSAGGSGGRRRPLGVVLGLSVTFTVTIAGAAKLVGGVGLGSGGLRTVAVVVLLAFGLLLVAPARVADRLEAPLSRLSRLGPRSRGDGFVSGLLVGGALGFVYTPCAGPILAAVVTGGAASGRTVAVALAYAAGSAAVLLALMLGGRRLLDRVRVAGRGPALRRVLGVVMAVTALAIVAGADVRFDQFVASNIPDVNATAGLERSRAVASRLGTLTGRRPRFAASASTPSAARAAASLTDLGPAPPFTNTQRWFNTPGGRPLTLAGLRGRVVLIDFWTYTCINCIRTLPYLRAWDARYRGSGLSIVGVHSPEFSFEHDAANVQSAIGRFGLSYPVVQDNQLGTWNAYGNQYWPAEYLIDASGHVRYVSFGEGDYVRTEAAIRALLSQTGRSAPGAPAQPSDTMTPSATATPETYMGAERAQGWVPREPTPGLHRYPGSPHLALNSFSLRGTWHIASQAATAVSGGQVDAQVQGRHVYAVLSAPGGRSATAQVLLDGRPVDARHAGADVHSGHVTVTAQRLYELVSAPGDERHHLTLRFDPGLSGYAFTFG